MVQLQNQIVEMHRNPPKQLMTKELLEIKKSIDEKAKAGWIIRKEYELPLPDTIGKNCMASCARENSR
jgi:hypothetical protein